MNKRIRSMIDAIFAEMKMTAENLALRDELMANAQARYEDMIAQGKTEEEAFAQVAASLEDVGDLLHEMNSEPDTSGSIHDDAGAQEEENSEEDEEAEIAEEDTEETEDETRDEIPQTDLGDALNKAFTMLGDWGQSIMPQAKKLVRQMDDATGGVLREIGRAVEKGVKDAQKTAGDMLDKKQQPAQDDGHAAKKTPEEMREEAKDLRAQAGLKRAVGIKEDADALDAQADALETQADAMEQAEALKLAQEDAQEQSGEDRDFDAETFATDVEHMSQEAERLVREAEDAINDHGSEAAEAVCGRRDPHSREVRFPVAGLRRIDIKLDADDVSIEPASGDEIVVNWTAQNVEGEPAVSMNNHALVIRRKNPDVFKTFFSVFSKNGGKIVVRVPRGYAADYAISTTSGDVHLTAVDVDDVGVSTTSGDVRVEPDTGVRARDLKIETISGSVTVSALAIAISAKSVSGNVFISCDCQKVTSDVVSGKLHIEGACDEWDVNAVSGRTELICTVAPAGKIKADTISASLLLTLPASIRGFVVEFESMSGKLTNEFGPDRFGTCALPIHLSTLSGDVMLTRL